MGVLVGEQAVDFFTSLTEQERKNRTTTQKKYISFEMGINGSQELWGKLKKQL